MLSCCAVVNPRVPSISLHGARLAFYKLARCTAFVRASILYDYPLCVHTAWELAGGGCVWRVRFFSLSVRAFLYLIYIAAALSVRTSLQDFGIVCTVSGLCRRCCQCARLPRPRASMKIVPHPLAPSPSARGSRALRYTCTGPCPTGCSPLWATSYVRWCWSASALRRNFRKRKLQKSLLGLVMAMHRDNP